MWMWIPTGWELIIVLVIVLVIFGAGRLPGVGKALGQTITEFKDSMKPKDPEKLDSEETKPETEK